MGHTKEGELRPDPDTERNRLPYGSVKFQIREPSGFDGTFFRLMGRPLLCDRESTVTLASGSVYWS